MYNKYLLFTDIISNSFSFLQVILILFPFLHIQICRIRSRKRSWCMTHSESDKAGIYLHVSSLLHDNCRQSEKEDITIAIDKERSCRIKQFECIEDFITRIHTYLCYCKNNLQQLQSLKQSLRNVIL